MSRKRAKRTSPLKRLIYFVGILLVLCVSVVAIVSFVPTRNSSTNAPSTSGPIAGVLLVNPENPLPENYRSENLVNLYKQNNRHFQLANADIKICKTVLRQWTPCLRLRRRTG
ncbi:hypothetical protein Desdi_0305 [Desulfitobacterium dichloroeliminans LMG P-21439]|uniref:Uncharacterized protein n=1 Tax=Desulfitobacterium dichloroeliminans (strain LMG P-21439 / DCA1) TaxID=871963 RepID=L0F4I1_DESDL|nr:hypothetical protein Desdi_0305 [Desulfitobacterium dichloroeliminans LMG P-21439]